MIDAYETSGTSPTVSCMNFEPLLNDAEAAKFLGQRQCSAWRDAEMCRTTGVLA